MRKAFGMWYMIVFGSSLTLQEALSLIIYNSISWQSPHLPRSGSFRAKPRDDCRFCLSGTNVNSPDLDRATHHLRQPLVRVDPVADERNVQHSVPEELSAVIIQVLF